MANLPGRLGTLTALDVMSSKLYVVYEQDTLESAVETLRQHHITGAPVIDEENRLVGILSVKDLVDATGGKAVQSPTPPVTPLAHGADPSTWDLFDRPEPLAAGWPAEKVHTRMSHQVTSVTGDAPLVEVARVMCNGHWHRVPVVDEQQSLIGIITTLDLLAAMVNSADESL